MGFQELYRPADGNVVVEYVAAFYEGVKADQDSSIVAVHGLQGDLLKTWTSKSDEKVCWLCDPQFLPKYLPQARVLTWGYNANVLALKGKTTSRDRILQHAQTLVSQLNGDREVGDDCLRSRMFAYTFSSKTPPIGPSSSYATLLGALS